MGVVLEVPDGEEVSYAVRLEFRATNNQAEYNHNFREFCQNLGNELKFCSPAHLQSNGQVEATNKVIKKLLKTRL